MKISFAVSLMVAALVVPSTVVLIPEAQAASGTEVKCNYEGGQWKTIASRGSTRVVLVEWNTSMGGRSVEQRCREVSSKLNWLSNTHNGSLYGIRMKTGEVKGSDVICYIDSSMGTGTFCNSGNHVMNLPSNNGLSPKQQLENLFKLIDNPYAAGTPVQNSAPDYEVDFGSAVEKMLDQAQNAGTPSNPNITPSERPPENSPHQGM